jgi:hypothetical protein
MDDLDLKKLIKFEVKQRLMEEKDDLAAMMETALLYTGEFASCKLIMDVFNEWKNK